MINLKLQSSNASWGRALAGRSFQSNVIDARKQCVLRLSAAADALELANRKDAAGERLMHQTSKPRRAHKEENPDGIYWFESQERLYRLYDYCRQDVEVERELFNRLPSLSPVEQAIWQLSYQINVRGFHIDRAFAEAARKIAEAAAPEIDAEITEITAGDVTGVNQVAKLLAWLQDHGCTLRKLDRVRSSASSRKSFRHRCSARSSSGSAAPKLRLKRSTPCLPVRVLTIVFAAASAITAQQPVGGAVKAFKLKT
jgi:hypothetical protein